MNCKDAPCTGAVAQAPSIGQKETNELAVMMDTFRGLQVSREAVDVEDGEYYLSWLEAAPGGG